jgi:hypothetical protein
MHGIIQWGWKDGWYDDGGNIIVAVVLVIAVSAVGKCKKSRQLEELSTKRSDIRVEVVREGTRELGGSLYPSLKLLWVILSA